MGLRYKHAHMQFNSSKQREMPLWQSMLTTECKRSWRMLKNTALQSESV